MLQSMGLQRDKTEIQNNILEHSPLKKKKKKGAVRATKPLFHPKEVEMKVAQSCLTLRTYGLYSPWNSLGQNTGVGTPSFLQGIFPTQGWNPGLPHCRQILNQLSHKERGRYFPDSIHSPRWGEVMRPL